jgi:hypothetical protein
MSFGEEFTRAFEATRAHHQQNEENKLRLQVLKHQIDSLKIEDQIRAREIAKGNYDLVSGRPAADIPSEDFTTQQPNLPSRSLAGMVTGLIRGQQGAGAEPPPPEPAPTTVPAPDAQATMSGTNPITRQRPQAMNIPGVPGLGVPGMSVRPRTAEDLVNAMIASELAKPQKTGPGETVTIPALGREPIARGGPRMQSVGAGGLVEIDPVTHEPKVVAPGRAPAPVRPMAGTINGRPAFALPGANGRFTIGGTDVTGKFQPMPRASETGATDRQAQRAWEHDWKQYQSAIAAEQRQHAEKFRTWTKQNEMALPGEETDPPIYTPPSFEDWRVEHGSGAAKAAKPAAPANVTQPADPLQAADPATGTVYRFPTAAAAAAYRKEKGVK